MFYYKMGSQLASKPLHDGLKKNFCGIFNYKSGDFFVNKLIAVSRSTVAATIRLEISYVILNA
jgi:hypothetical protein